MPIGMPGWPGLRLLDGIHREGPGEIEALTMRVDAALMKARAVHAALD
jgi:hypothetical protein